MSDNNSSPPTPESNEARSSQENKRTCTTSLSRCSAGSETQCETTMPITQQSKEEEMAIIMGSAAVLSVLEMGEKPWKIKAALEKLYKKTGTYKHCAKDLMEEVLEIPDSEGRLHTTDME